MKLLADENLPTSLVALLRSHGHNVKTARGARLHGAPDSDLLARCIHEGRLLVTLDMDFANLRRYPPRTHPGIIVIRLKRQSVRRVAHAMTQFLRIASLEDCRGRLTIVEDEGYRRRIDG